MDTSHDEPCSCEIDKLYASRDPFCVCPDSSITCSCGIDNVRCQGALLQIVISVGIGVLMIGIGQLFEIL
jgi:hypothetical protein